MRTALVILLSLAVHAGIVAAGLIYFPQATRQFTTSQIVPLELIDDIVPVTNLPEEEEDEEPVEDETPPDPEVSEPDVTPEPEVEDTPAPEVEAQPQAEPAPLPETEPEAPAEPTQRPTPSRTRDTLDDLLGDLANVVDEERTASPSRNQSRGAQSSEAIGITLADSIRTQAQRCYRSSIDAPNPERLIVVVRVRLNRDGSLDGRPEPLNRHAIDLAGDRFWNVARDRALAAIIDCAPFRLPAEHYSIWRRIDVTFRQETR
ncbi:hypothetical protein [Hyphobacterium sp.]|jgi:outer membrane biosynthesis protein TonB|uniref:hypothetical protein n=1 Tax=Hyphobacterium sp. TaxID=2004662 RepID=UPI003BAC3BB3